jgi:hypothetical protein
MNINDIKIPEEFKDSHFPHQVKKDEWYLVPNEAVTSYDQAKKFECWLVNGDGSIARGIAYGMTRKELRL